MASSFEAAMAKGNTAALEFWFQEYEPLHFLNVARSRYHYQPRSGDDEPPRIPRGTPIGGGTPKMRSNPHYSWRKRRQMGHNLPLVWSGASAQAARTVAITSSSQQGRLAFKALPKYFYQYLKAGTYTKQLYDRTVEFTLKHDQPKKFQELIIVIPEEAMAMARAADAAATAYLKQLSLPSTINA